MGILIASDIHGSALYCGRMLERMEAERAEQLVLLGDLLYHGPRNDLPEGYAPKEVIAMLNRIKDHILCVRGNCDAEVDQMVLDFPITAEYRVENLCGRRLFFTHGHHYNLQKQPGADLLRGAEYVIYGHTHVPLKERAGNVWYLNPGSVSLPKDGSSHSCILMTEHEIRWMDLDGETLGTLAPR
jgi:putative phosphoesterase